MITLLFFTSKYCAPCKQIKPWVQALPAQYPKLAVQEINTDDDKTTPAQYSAVFMPTLVWLKNGQEINRQDGAAGITPDFLANLAATYTTPPITPNPTTTNTKNSPKIALSAADWFFITLAAAAIVALIVSMFKR